MHKVQRGFTLLELMVVVGLAAMIMIALMAMTHSKHGGELDATREVLVSGMVRASSLAGTTGNGASLVIVPPSGSFPGKVEVFAGRPGNASYPLPATPDHTAYLPTIRTSSGLTDLIAAVTGQNSVSATTTTAVYIDGFGTATYGQWSTTSAPPTCTSGGADLQIQLTQDSTTQYAHLPCGGDAFTIYKADNTTVLPTPAP